MCIRDSFGALSPSIGGWLGLPTLLIGVALSAGSLVVGSRADTRTAYRRDPWLTPEWVVAALGVLVAATFVLAEATAIPGMSFAQSHLAWPEIPWAPALLVIACAAAVPATPVPPRLAAHRAPILAIPGEIA